MADPVKTASIPYIHRKMKLSDLNDNGKLFTDAQIKVILEYPALKDFEGRVTKKRLNEIFSAEIDNKTIPKFTFSLEKFKDRYFGVYKGKESSLGSGAFGSVKLLQDLATGETTEVVKVIKKKFINKEAIEKAKTEIEKEKRGLEITNQFETVFKRPDKPHQYELIMGIAKGCPLEDLGGKNLPTVVWLDIIINVLKAVKDLHNQGVIHRDLKPPNILYDVVAQKATVIDLGLATVVADSQAVIDGVKDDSMGTPDYMAPSVLQGNYNEKSEIFALGVTFARLLNLVNYEKKYFAPWNETAQVAVVSTVDTAAAKYVIADDNTRNVIHTMLQAMVQDNNNLSLQAIPKHVNLIDFFTKIREEYVDTLGLTKRIAYITVDDFLGPVEAFDDKAMAQALSNVDEVWLVDNGKHSQVEYLGIHHYLIEAGFNVNNEIIQYEGDNLDQAMRDYADQRERSDRNIYDCSYVTRAGQLASLTETLNQEQINKIITSLNQVTEGLYEKYGPKGQARIKAVNEAISTLQKINRVSPITYDKALRELDKLQSTMLGTPESQANIRKLMQEIESMLPQKTATAAVKGFAAVKKHQDRERQMHILKEFDDRKVAIPPEDKKKPLSPQPPPLPKFKEVAPPLPPRPQHLKGLFKPAPNTPAPAVPAKAVAPKLEEILKNHRQPPPLPAELRAAAAVKKEDAKPLPDLQGWLQKKDEYSTLIQTVTESIHKSSGQQNKNRFKQFANDSVSNTTAFYTKLLESASTLFQQAIIIHSLLENNNKVVDGKDAASEKELFQTLKSLAPKEVETFLTSLKRAASSDNPQAFQDTIIKHLKQLDPTPENIKEETPKQMGRAV